MTENKPEYIPIGGYQITKVRSFSSEKPDCEYTLITLNIKTYRAILLLLFVMGVMFGITVFRMLQL